MKKRVKAILGISLCVAFMMSLNIGSEAYAQDAVEKKAEVYQQKASKKIVDAKRLELQKISNADAELVLNELNLEKAKLSEVEKIAILTRGTSTVWNTTYTGKTNIKKSFAMSASVISSNSRPYTTFTITNTGKNAITAVAYKGAILGSKTIRSMTILPGKSKSMTVTRSDVLKFGNLNGQGNMSILSYSVSLYNTNAKAISCKAKAVRYD